MSETLLACERLVIGYGGRGLVPPIDLAVRRGDFVAVVGRNGSGKSTWFRTLVGMQAPVSGRVVRGSARSAYVPQTAGLDSALPVRAREVVAWGRLSGWNFLNPLGGRREHAAVASALERAGATPLAHRRFRELSEGQKQRVLLARVLATEADVVLLDEPTAAMDVVAERETMERLSRLARESAKAVIVITHELSVAREWANQVLFIDREAPASVVGDAATVFCHPAFKRQYGDDYCEHAAQPRRSLGPAV